ncbi:MAG: hypothetical protein K8S62_13935 [Candidatus Sabulitectum sp.]|nr:hypothetical protein [Candidatus Sabulitectum sp.]
MITLIILVAGLQVHEWGVITQTPLSLSGAIPEIQPWENELEDKAPVVYFHGDPCTVTVRISFPGMGYASEVLPAPDEGGVNSTYILWNDLELTESPGSGLTEGWRNQENLNFPIPVWRQVDALCIATSDRYDHFIYYECIPGRPGDLPFISESGNHSFRMPYGEIPCVILTSVDGIPMYGTFTLADIVTDIPKGLQFLDEPIQLRRELWQWAEGVLNEDEFDSFWNTWESQFLSDSETDVMIIYRVPEEILEQIATMEVIPDTQIEIDINRFIIAELPYRTL